MKKISACALVFLMLALLFAQFFSNVSAAAPNEGAADAVSSLLEFNRRTHEMIESCSDAVEKGAPDDPFNSARLIVKAFGELDASGVIGISEGWNGRSILQYASPAAACCAEIKTYDPDIGPDDIMALLKENAVDEGYSGGGAGRLCVSSLFGNVPGPVLIGDVNLNGSVESSDALICLRHALGIMTLEGDALAAADANGDGVVDSTDALTILRIAMGLRDSF